MYCLRIDGFSRDIPKNEKKKKNKNPRAIMTSLTYSRAFIMRTRKRKKKYTPILAPGLVPNSSPQHNPFFTRRVGGMRRNLSSYRDTRVVIHIFGTQFDWARLITVRARAEPVFADGSRKKTNLSQSNV